MTWRTNFSWMKFENSLLLCFSIKIYFLSTPLLLPWSRPFSIYFPFRPSVTCIMRHRLHFLNLKKKLQCILLLPRVRRYTNKYRNSVESWCGIPPPQESRVWSMPSISSIGHLGTEHPWRWQLFIHGRWNKISQFPISFFVCLPSACFC